MIGCIVVRHTADSRYFQCFSTNCHGVSQLDLVFFAISLFQHHLIICLCQMSLSDNSKIDLLTVLKYSEYTLIFHIVVQIKILLQSQTLFCNLSLFRRSQGHKYRKLAILNLMFPVGICTSLHDRFGCPHQRDHQIHTHNDQYRQRQITEFIGTKIPQDSFSQYFLHYKSSNSAAGTLVSL